MITHKFSKEYNEYHPDTSSIELGGKGFGLITMTRVGVSVPPGFVISTTTCMDYLKENDEGKTIIMNTIMDQVMEGMDWLTSELGYTPLVSVRSGARVSMPGMMDTILNVGLCDETFDFWCERIGLKAALDSKRRLMQMMGSTAYEIDSKLFEDVITLAKRVKYGGKEAPATDADLGLGHLTKIIEHYHKIYKDHIEHDFKFNAKEQLRISIESVFKSWNNPRAIHYRDMHGYSHDWGTAVTIQSMVFGNLNNNSCSGVLFTRCPNTGDEGTIGEFLINAQGEDVVAGIRTPQPLHEMNDWNEKLELELLHQAQKLELLNKDMQDIEFTVEDGELYILQTRTGKRSAESAFIIAQDLLDEDIITTDDALSRVTYEQYLTLKRSRISPEFKEKPTAIGIPASGYVVTGVLAFSNDFAINCTAPCILISKETTPDDIKGMEASVGILTQTGGATSHAAVVARGMDKVCVVGCSGIQRLNANSWTIGDTTVKEGESITIDGSTGNVWVNTKVPVIEGIVPPKAKKLISNISYEGGVIKEIITPTEGIITDKESYINTVTSFEDGNTLADLLDCIATEEDSSYNPDSLVYLDLNEPYNYREAGDEILWGAFGTDANVGNDIYFKLDLLNKSYTVLKDKVALILPNHIHSKLVEKVKSQGWSVVLIIATIDELMDSKGIVEISNPFIESVGSVSTATRLTNLVSKTNDIRVVPKACSYDELLIEKLG